MLILLWMLVKGVFFCMLIIMEMKANLETFILQISVGLGLVYPSEFLSLLHNTRSNEGRCDFDKVHGLDGIYLANVFDVDYTNQYFNTFAEQK